MPINKLKSFKFSGADRFVKHKPRLFHIAKNIKVKPRAYITLYAFLC